MLRRGSSLLGLLFGATATTLALLGFGLLWNDPDKPSAISPDGSVVDVRSATDGNTGAAVSEASDSQQESSLVLPSIAQATSVTDASGKSVHKKVTTPATTIASPQSETRQDAQAAIRLFEAECQKQSTEMLAACRAVSGRPTETIRDFGHGDLVGVGAQLETLSKGTGLTAGCARGTLGFFTVYGPLLMEATARMAGQDVPQGGLASIIDSWCADGFEEVKGVDDKDMYQMRLAHVYVLTTLLGDDNAFNGDLDRQLVSESPQPRLAVMLTGESRRVRGDLRSRLIERYSGEMKEYIRKHGLPVPPGP